MVAARESNEDAASGADPGPVSIRAAESQDIGKILNVSMGAFYGVEDINLLDLPQLLAVRKTPNGKPYFGIEYQWTRLPILSSPHPTRVL